MQHGQSRIVRGSTTEASTAFYNFRDFDARDSEIAISKRIPRNNSTFLVKFNRHFLFIDRKGLQRKIRELSFIFVTYGGKGWLGKSCDKANPDECERKREKELERERTREVSMLEARARRPSRRVQFQVPSAARPLPPGADEAESTEEREK